MTVTFLRMVVVVASLFLPLVAAAESAERCQDLPADGGDCRGYFVKWTYTEGRGCHTFTYGGCGGSENRFPSQEDCQQHCQQGLAGNPRDSDVSDESMEPDVSSESMEPDVSDDINVSDVSSDSMVPDVSISSNDSMEPDVSEDSDVSDVSDESNESNESNESDESDESNESNESNESVESDDRDVRDVRDVSNISMKSEKEEEEEEACSREKKVGGVTYKLVGREDDQFTAEEGCLTDCIYTIDNSDKMVCFIRGEDQAELPLDLLAEDSIV